MKTVMAAGSFDLIHEGHIYFLNEAKRKGDKLVVVVARDSSILKFKGKRPKYNERERLEHVRALSMVDRAVLGKEGNIYDIVLEIKPDIIVMGYDQKPESTEFVKNELEKRGFKPEVIRVHAYRPELFKSSKLKRE